MIDFTFFLVIYNKVEEALIKLKLQQKLRIEKEKLQEQENLKKLHSMAVAASKTRQKLINALIKNATKLTDKSKQEVEKWLKNITGKTLTRRVKKKQPSCNIL